MRATTLALVATLSASAGPQVLAGTAETVSPVEVQMVSDAVVEALRFHGFDKVQAGAPMPVNLIALYNGHAGETDGATITINARAPDACRTRILAHELTHILIARAYGAVPESEAIARAVEEIVSPGYMPNCDRGGRL